MTAQIIKKKDCIDNHNKQFTYTKEKKKKKSSTFQRPVSNLANKQNHFVFYNKRNSSKPKKKRQNHCSGKE